MYGYGYECGCGCWGADLVGVEGDVDDSVRAGRVWERDASGGDGAAWGGSRLPRYSSIWLKLCACKVIVTPDPSDMSYILLDKK